MQNVHQTLHDLAQLESIAAKTMKRLQIVLIWACMQGLQARVLLQKLQSGGWGETFDAIFTTMGSRSEPFAAKITSKGWSHSFKHLQFHSKWKTCR